MCQRARMLTLAALSIGLAWTALDRLGPAQVVLAERVTAAEVKPMMSADQAWKRLKAGNNRFSEGMSERPDIGASRRQMLARGQEPFAIVLTCADSRLTPEFIFNQGLGDLFVVRVAGNIAEPFALGSIEYAVDHLHVPLIVLLGHEKCGAVEAAMSKERLPGHLGKLISEIDVGNASALAPAITNNARHQARLLSARSSIIKEYVAKKKVRVVSGVYQLATGKVEWLD